MGPNQYHTRDKKHLNVSWVEVVATVVVAAAIVVVAAVEEVRSVMAEQIVGHRVVFELVR